MKYTKLMEIIRETINEELAFESQASDDAKKQGLEYMGFGRYGKDGKITHTTQSGKLVSVRDANDRIDQRRAFPVRGRKSPEAQRTANAPKPDMSPSADTHAKIVSKVKDKLSAWYDSADADDMEHVPTAEFSKMTGIPERALRMYGQTNPDPMEDGVYYDAERDTFTIGGYPDGYGDGDTPFDDEL